MAQICNVQPMRRLPRPWNVLETLWRLWHSTDLKVGHRFVCTYLLHPTCTCLHRPNMHMSAQAQHAHVCTGPTCTCLHRHNMHMSAQAQHAHVCTGPTCTCLHRPNMHMSAQAQHAHVCTGTTCTCLHRPNMHTNTGWEQVTVGQVTTNKMITQNY